jgi:hypothetical protein
MSLIVFRQRTKGKDAESNIELNPAVTVHFWTTAKALGRRDRNSTEPTPPRPDRREIEAA